MKNEERLMIKKSKEHRTNFSLFTFLFSLVFLFSCSVQHKLNKAAIENILSKPAEQAAHIGIAVYDADAKKYLYRYNSKKYFIPASNVKLFTCYAAMQYLGDSLPGLKVTEDNSNIYLFPTGDPSLLMEDFAVHPVAEWLRKTSRPLYVVDTCWKENALGFGWSWDDYEADYMAERSALPLHGNLASFSGNPGKYDISPFLTEQHFKAGPGNGYISEVNRSRDCNYFTLSFGGKKNDTIRVPFVTEDGSANLRFLSAALDKKINRVDSSMLLHLPLGKPSVIYSQPLDSLLRIMMHRSDNFFAEQSLLMVSNQLTGVMNDQRIIDTLLKTLYKDVPQIPKWVDGSGLSRYNLFTPEDFVFVLEKMRTTINWKRISTILPTGGAGTISNYYQQLKGRIFVKTGTLSNNVALSGYLITRRDKTLLFSILVNNHMASASEIRRDVEAFITELADEY